MKSEKHCFIYQLALVPFYGCGHGGPGTCPTSNSLLGGGTWWSDSRCRVRGRGNLGGLWGGQGPWAEWRLGTSVCVCSAVHAVAERPGLRRNGRNQDCQLSSCPGQPVSIEKPRDPAVELPLLNKQLPRASLAELSNRGGGSEERRGENSLPRYHHVSAITGNYG